MHDIDDILAKHFSGLPLNTEQDEQLEVWKLENPKEFEAIEASMSAQHAQAYKVFDTKKGWQKMSARIDAANTTKTFTLKPLLKYAAVASIALLIGIVGLQIFNNNGTDMLVFENNTTKSDSLILPDGSQIFLAPNSTLSYAANFKDNRSLNLDGEAFFDVTKNKAKPFKIETEKGVITVLGTSFNVNTKNNKTKVDVKTGLVSLSHNNQEVKLAKNESAWSNGKNISQKLVVDINALAWRTGNFKFNNTPFEEVVKFLESFYGDVIDSESEARKECAFTGTFTNENIDGIIEALVLSCNLEFSKENGRIILK